MDQELQQKTAELLAQLRDVDVPHSSWWPPAPGWWVLAILLLALTAYGVFWAIRWRREYQWVSVAEAELAALRTAFNERDISAQEAVSRLSVLIRRSAIAALGRRAVARATDEEWLQVLSRIGGGKGFAPGTADKLVTAPYRAQPLAEAEVLELFDSCEVWLKATRSVRRPVDV